MKSKICIYDLVHKIAVSAWFMCEMVITENKKKGFMNLKTRYMKCNILFATFKLMVTSQYSD
jgi:hypothetical protein